jgi:hypothetical protein
MRHLSAKQKKILKAERKKLINNGVFAPSCDDLPYNVYQSTFELNRFEDYDTCVDRFFSDLYFDEIDAQEGFFRL